MNGPFGFWKEIIVVTYAQKETLDLDAGSNNCLQGECRVVG